MELWQRRRLWRTLLALVIFIGFLLYAWSLRPTRSTSMTRHPILSGNLASSTAPWEVTPLEDETLQPALVADFAAARESIDVAMYVIRMDAAGPVHAVMDALAGAAKRGVRIRVLMDRSLQGADRHDLFNRAAAARLQEAHVSVRFDRPEMELHDKLVIIDGRIVYVGAHNWTPDALAENHELSLRLKSSETITEAASVFTERWASGSDPGRVIAELPSSSGSVMEDDE